MTASRSGEERDGSETVATSRLRADGGRLDGQSGRSLGDVFDLEEFRRRNASAVAIDVLYLFTTAFFASLFVRGLWPAVFAALPLALLLYFSWRSTTAFLVAQVLAIVLAVGATFAGVLPL